MLDKNVYFNLLYIILSKTNFKKCIGSHKYRKCVIITFLHFLFYFQNHKEFMILHLKGLEQDIVTLNFLFVSFCCRQTAVCYFLSLFAYSHKMQGTNKIWQMLKYKYSRIKKLPNTFAQNLSSLHIHILIHANSQQINFLTVRFIFPCAFCSL